VELRERWLELARLALPSLLLDSPKAKEVAPMRRALVRKMEREAFMQ
jgi:hypothetical protein